jgi:glutaredoxin-like protein
MSLMDDDTKNKVRETLLEMKNPVHILIFTEKENCSMCNETKLIVEEVSSLGDKVTFEEMDIQEEKETAEKYGVDKVPAIIPLKGTSDKNEYLGIRFFGIPAGYEFTSLLDSIMTISHGEVGISDEGKEYLKSIKKEVHLQVFVTPTCPYCPRSVILAHHMAQLNDKITADMVEAQEFPELSQKFKVMGVPRTIINEDFHQEGAAPERMIIDHIKKTQ